MDDREFRNFWVKVLPNPDSGCWEWIAALGTTGYGAFGLTRNGKHEVYKAHRVAYSHFVAEPGAMHVLHHCDNPLCVRPEHLFLGTHAQNMRDMANKGRNGLPPVPREQRGERNCMAKLTAEQVIEIRRSVAAGETQAAVRARFNIAAGTCSHIVHGRRWKHIPLAGQV